ncbi:Uma2 family endonuclease [Picosynechococcus sp. NKBG15041c]|uniref:Uma2 family endonuclease n=1 Tax=Picosynechococcus sp. NKBG15041c TaxID=1407650 RepID=UPI00040773F5
MDMTLPLVELNLENCNFSDEQFFQLCQQNKNFRFERNAQGDLAIMSPTGGETSNRNIELSYQLQAWNRHTKLGMAFDSSGGFILPNGAMRSPDAAWIPLARWDTLEPEAKTRFLPLCPDFVVELLSPTDSLPRTQAKLQEFIDNGTRLGWLINRATHQVEVYRPDQPVETLELPEFLNGETVLPDFQLDLSTIW